MSPPHYRVAMFSSLNREACFDPEFCRLKRGILCKQCLFVIYSQMQKSPPSTNIQRNQYNGYTAEVTSPSLVLYPADAIRKTLQYFNGMAVVVSEKLGLGKPRVRGITPVTKRVRAFNASGEIAGFAQNALLWSVQNRLSNLKPKN
jgi:hypothetical protein